MSKHVKQIKCFKRITHMSTICLFSLDMFPASLVALVNDAFLRAFVAPRTAAWQPKTPFDLPLRVESPHNTKRPSAPSGHRRPRRGHLELPCAIVGLLCSCGKHLRMLIERTEKEWTLCSLLCKSTRRRKRSPSNSPACTCLRRTRMANPPPRTLWRTRANSRPHFPWMQPGCKIRFKA